ncbi:hypothetical protein ACFVSU_03205 [Microbacterium sp. NPDC058062]|uniref:hypothetical protein n=1 Tax=Microbacterium sp. NPDC058062 TaxID=3346320 RepID=UPI0036DD3766
MTGTAAETELSRGSRRRFAMPSRWGLVWIAAAIGLAIAYGVAWLMGPHPDHTLHTAVSQVGFPSSYSPVEVDAATLEPHEMFRGLQPWSATDSLGNRCLIITEPAGSSSWVHGGSCIPREADVVVDVGVWPDERGTFAEGLPDGTVIRFQLRGDEVDVSVHTPTEPAEP